MRLTREFPIFHGSPPDAPPPAPPRNVGSLWRESSVAWEALRLVGAAPRLLGRTQGPPRTAVLVPGFGTSGSSLAPLRRFLAWRGHDARDWGLGLNRGDPEGDVEQLVPILEGIHAEVGEPLVMIGWSLGGVIAREIARMRPELVRHVITYGTPVIGGPTYTLAGSRWSADEKARIIARIEELDRDDAIQVPITAMFTRSDRIVAWSACLDHHSQNVEHIEIGSGHLGMILDPDVWSIVVERMERANT